MFHHTLYKTRVEKIYICYRQRGEEALGETTGLIELGFLITKILHVHIRLEDCETVDTITVETNTRETMNKKLWGKNGMQGEN